jgi:predicted transcriptional regulator of viral defense system
MLKDDIIFKAFKNNGGILKTSDLNSLGITSRQINRLLDEGKIIRIKHGFYELTSHTYPDEVIISRLFPQSVIFLESALMTFGYTDRIPLAWQIAVDRDSKKSQYKIEYPSIDVFYMKPNLLELGVEINKIEGVDVKVFNRERTICDILRYESKLEKETFTKAIQRYVKDHNKNVKKLLEYSEILNIKNKVQTYIGVWL